MPTSKQDKDFASAMDQHTHFDDCYGLDAAITWIGENLAPEDVFTDSDLKCWALENGFSEEE
jgi:hypothetical protein